jgi:hypothetical protein
MPSDQFRVSVYLPRDAEAVVRSIAARRGIGVNAVFRLALGVLQAHEDAREAGQYVGTTRVREHLEQVIVAPL